VETWSGGKMKRWRHRKENKGEAKEERGERRAERGDI